MPTETRRSGLVQSPKLAAAAHCFALPSVTNGTAFWGRLPCGQGRQTIHAETRMKEAFDPPNTQKSGDWLRKTRVCESSPTARLRSRVGSSISLSCTRRHPSALYLNSLKIPQDEQRSNVSTRYSVLTNVARTYSVAILTAGDPLIWAPKKEKREQVLLGPCGYGHKCLKKSNLRRKLHRQLQIDSAPIICGREIVTPADAAEIQESPGENPEKRSTRRKPKIWGPGEEFEQNASRQKRQRSKCVQTLVRSMH